MRKRLRFLVSILAVFAASGAGADVGWPQAVTAAGKVRNLVAVSNSITTVPAANSAIPLATGIGPGTRLIITFDSIPGTVYGCTANYLWSSSQGLLLGSAGHCFIPEDPETGDPIPNPGAAHVKACLNGCFFGGQTGFIVQGTLSSDLPVVYARSNGPGDDFGLVKIPSGHCSSVTPSMPVWGGPNDIRDVTLGLPVVFFGNADGLGEVFATMGRAGVGVGTFDGEWLADAPSAPGDSGAAVNVVNSLSPSIGGLAPGAAGGILTHLVVDLGFVAGTSVGKAQEMAGMSITPVLAGETPACP